MQLRELETRLAYLRELEERRAAVLTGIAEQGKLTDELRQKILEVDTKARLEDLYLPFKPKRRTKAMIAMAWMIWLTAKVTPNARRWRRRTCVAGPGQNRCSEEAVKARRKKASEV